jgi:hypothetical protein
VHGRMGIRGKGENLVSESLQKQEIYMKRMVEYFFGFIVYLKRIIISQFSCFLFFSISFPFQEKPLFPILPLGWNKMRHD